MKVLACWRANSVVGTTTATCLPFIATAKAARSATSVLPKPTSPQIRRSIGRPAPSSLSTDIDGGLLVFGLLIGEAGAEFVVGPRLRRQARRLAQLPLGRHLDQRARDLADALLHARLAGLPADAAETVELGAGLVRAVARQELDVLDRQEQLVAARIVQLEAVVGGAGRLDGAQPDEAADAVIDVDHEIAGREAGDLGDEILRLAGAAARPHQAIAENVLLADEGGLGGLETAFEPEHRQPDLRGRQPQRRRPRRHRSEIGEPVVGEHMAHALARAFAPQRDDHALARGLQAHDMLRHRLEHVAAGLVALGGEIASRPGAGIDHRALALRHRKRGEPRQRRQGEPLAPLRLGQIKPLGRQRLVERAGAGLAERLPAGLEIVVDLVAALARRVLDLRLEHHGRARQVIEQRVEAGVEQRQPMLHPDMAAALAHRVVELIVGRRRPEGFHIAQAETPDGLGGELELGDRNQIERMQLIGGALALGIEAADRFQRVAEEVEPHRLGHAGRIEIDDAAAHRIVARLAHGGGAGKAVELEPARDAAHVEHVAGGDGERLGGDEIARRHALERRIDGGQQHRADGRVPSGARAATAPSSAAPPRRHGATSGHRAGNPRTGIPAP